MIRRMTAQDYSEKTRGISTPLWIFLIQIKNACKKRKHKEKRISQTEISQRFQQSKLAKALTVVVKQSEDYFLDIVTVTYDTGHVEYLYKEEEILILIRAMGDTEPTIEWLLSDDCLQRFKRERGDLDVQEAVIEAEEPVQEQQQ